MASRTGELERMEAIEDARVYIAEHYDEAITIDLLAGIARLSPKYFGELFKKRFGQSAMDYVTEVRIRHAKRYLRETDELLRDIARKVGYSDEFYFSRKFKKEVGLAPSAYLRNSKQRIAALSPSSIGYLLALGIVPVAAPLDAKWTAYYYQAYASRIPFHLRPDDGDFSEDAETLLRSRPDIVVSHESPSDSGLSAALERSALPLFVPAEQDNWTGKLRRLASFLGKEERCEAWIVAYRRKADLARRDVERRAGTETFVALRLWGHTFHLYCNQGIRDVVYRDLGLQPAYSPPEAGLYNEPIDLDAINRLNPDRVLLLVCPDAETRAGWLAIQHSPRWRALNAVGKGQVHLIPSDPWYEYSAFSIDRMLDEMVMMITGKCPSHEPDSVHGGSISSEL